MSWILKMSLCWMFSLSLISLGMVILPRTPTLMTYSAMDVICEVGLYGFVWVSWHRRKSNSRVELLDCLKVI